jgi:type VI secretion system VasD/TssJ family lipoprotein
MRSLFVKTLYVLLTLLLIAVLSACMSSPASPPEWKMQKEGIILNLKADGRLNESRGKAYTLYFVVYQLINPNGFNQLSQDNDGLGKLLESKIFDSSVASVKSVVVYPGSDVTYRMDRAEGAMYVGVVAGYNVMAKERMVKLFEVPVYVKYNNVFRTSKKLVPGNLEINMVLGPQQIEDVKGKK